ncbi:hypothetical protein ACLKA6_017748 [Drosophila palustris]
MAAIYCPPGHAQFWSPGEFSLLFGQLSDKFIVAGDWNAHHSFWGCLRSCRRGSALLSYVSSCRLEILATGGPTHFPSDRGRNPSAIDFAVYAGISGGHLTINESYELSSDHLPLIIYLSAALSTHSGKPRLLPRGSNIRVFKSKLASLLNDSPPYVLNSTTQIDNAAQDLVYKIHSAAAASMVNHRNASSPGASRTPVKPEILSLLRRKRELRRRWMSTRHPLDKAEFNAATNLLRKALFEAKSDYFVDKLRAIDPNQNRGFALWKCTRSLKRQPMRRFSLLRRDGTWARSDLDIAEEFANDLCERFTPFDLATDEEVLVTTTFSGVNSGPIAHISPISAPEVVEQVKRLKPNKAPGHDGLDAAHPPYLCHSACQVQEIGLASQAAKWAISDCQGAAV